MAPVVSRAEIVERKGVAFVSKPENAEMSCELTRPLRGQFQASFLAATARYETVPLPQHRELRKSSSSLSFEMPIMKLCYSRLILPTVLVSNGKHYSPQTIFKRWQRCFQKQRLFGRMAMVEHYPRALLGSLCQARRDFASLCLFRRHGRNNRCISPQWRARLERPKQSFATPATLFPD